MERSGLLSRYYGVDRAAPGGRYVYSLTNDTNSSTPSQHQGGSEASSTSEQLDQVSTASGKRHNVPAVHIHDLWDCWRQSDAGKVVLTLPVYTETSRWTRLDSGS
jgi:hypothetical protein